MTLIDHFNAFQTFSENKGLSPNVRSLYYAILGEFNKRRYLESVKISNAYLQHVSGISAKSSFDAARNVLINANIISHKAGNYSLIQPTKFENESGGYYWEYPRKVAVPPKKLEKLSMPEATPVQTTKYVVESPKRAVADELIKFVSAEVAQAWVDCEGVKLGGAQISDLNALEKLLGVEELVQKIREASIASNYENFPQLTYQFFKMIVNNPKTKKGATNNGRKSRNDTGTGRVIPADDEWQKDLPDWVQ